MVRYILPLNRFCAIVTWFPLELVVMVLPLELLSPMPKHPCMLNATSSKRQKVSQGVYLLLFMIVYPELTLARLEAIQRRQQTRDLADHGNQTCYHCLPPGS